MMISLYLFYRYMCAPQDMQGCSTTALLVDLHSSAHLQHDPCDPCQCHQLRRQQLRRHQLRGVCGYERGVQAGGRRGSGWADRRRRKGRLVGSPATCGNQGSWERSTRFLVLPASPSVPLPPNEEDRGSQAARSGVAHTHTRRSQAGNHPGGHPAFTQVVAAARTAHLGSPASMGEACSHTPFGCEGLSS